MEAPNDWEMLDDLLEGIDDARKKLIMYVVSKLVGMPADTRRSAGPTNTVPSVEDVEGAESLMEEAGVDKEQGNADEATDPSVRGLLGDDSGKGREFWPKGKSSGVISGTE